MAKEFYLLHVSFNTKLECDGPFPLNPLLGAHPPGSAAPIAGSNG